MPKNCVPLHFLKALATQRPFLKLHTLFIDNTGIENGSESDHCRLLAEIICNTVTKDTNNEILNTAEVIHNLLHHKNSLDPAIGSITNQLVLQLNHILGSSTFRQLLRKFREIVVVERAYTKIQTKTAQYYALGFVGLKWNHKNQQLRQLAGMKTHENHSIHSHIISYVHTDYFAYR